MVLPGQNIFVYTNSSPSHSTDPKFEDFYSSNVLTLNWWGHVAMCYLLNRKMNYWWVFKFLKSSHWTVQKAFTVMHSTSDIPHLTQNFFKRIKWNKIWPEQAAFRILFPKKISKKKTHQRCHFKMSFINSLLLLHTSHTLFSFSKVARQSFQNCTNNANTFKAGLWLTDFSQLDACYKIHF